MTTESLLAVLRVHYIRDAPPGATAGGVFVAEVGVNGEWGASSRCDALYAGFTSASGRILIGHEIKVSRSDWLAELRKVGKADTWADACHAWHVVVPDEAVVKREELPEGWGLMLPPKRGKRMQIAVKAKVKENHNPPWWAVRSMMARLDTLEAKARSQEFTAKVEAEINRREAARRRDLTGVPFEVKQRLKRLEKLERALGCEVADFNDHQLRQLDPATIAHGLRLAKSLTSSDYELARLRGVIHTLDELKANIDSVADVVEALGIVDAEPKRVAA